MNDKLIIKKKALKGEDGYKTFSIRIRNDLINVLFEYAIKNCEIKKE